MRSALAQEDEYWKGADRPQLPHQQVQTAQLCTASVLLGLHRLLFPTLTPPDSIGPSTHTRFQTK
jgi:hypothetical protein